MSKNSQKRSLNPKRRPQRNLELQQKEMEIQKVLIVIQMYNVRLQPLRKHPTLDIS